jgi:hypothetical protein
MGLKRSKYLCATNYSEDYFIQGDVSCTSSGVAGDRTNAFRDIPGPLEPVQSEWYLVCGRPHGEFTGFVAGVCALSGAGAAAFSFALSARKGEGEGKEEARFRQA